MSDTEREQVRHDGAGAPDDIGAWHLDRPVLWEWIGASLRYVPATHLGQRALRTVCARALETHAPAALVQAQAAGILLEHLVCAALIEAYGDRFGTPVGPYDVRRLVATARRLAREAG